MSETCRSCAGSMERKGPEQVCYGCLDRKYEELQAELKEEKMGRSLLAKATDQIRNYECQIEVLRGKIKFALEIPESVDYEQDPCGQINKVCEILEEALKGAPQRVKYADESHLKPKPSEDGV